MSDKCLTIACDFDSTLVTMDYPGIGKIIPGAVESLKELQRRGHKLILHTMRNGRYLEDAVTFMRGLGIEFWSINSNPIQKNKPEMSRKVLADLYIDDRSVGVPLLPGEERLVDWKQVMKLIDNHLEPSLEYQINKQRK